MSILRKILVVALLVGGMAPAGAAEGTHCATLLVPLEPMRGATSAALEPIGCFATYEAAIEAGTGWTVDAPAGATPVTITAEALVTAGVAASVLIGTEYDGNLFAGSSQSYFAPTTCTTGVSWEVANVGATWNDRFQSGKGFGGCDANRKFEHQNFGGAVKLCTPSCTDYGTLSNEVTSLRWRP